MQHFNTYEELQEEITKRHYDNIVGLSCDITEEQYYDFLEILPPIFVKGGFILQEFLKGDTTLKFKDNMTCEVVNYKLR